MRTLNRLNFKFHSNNQFSRHFILVVVDLSETALMNGLAFAFYFVRCDRWQVWKEIHTKIYIFDIKNQYSMHAFCSEIFKEIKKRYDQKYQLRWNVIHYSDGQVVLFIDIVRSTTIQNAFQGSSINDVRFYGESVDDFGL